MENRNVRIAKNTVILYLRMAIVTVVYLYTTRLVLQNLGVEDYGIYNVVYGFVTMFATFNTTLTAGVNRYYNYEIGQSGLVGVKKIYNVAIRIQLLFLLIMLVLVESVGVWYVNHSMVMSSGRIVSANCVLQCAVVSVILQVLLNPYSAAVLAFEKMNFYAMVSVMDVFLKLGIAIGIAYSPIDKLVFYAILMALLSIVNFFAYFIYCKIKYTKCFILEKTFDKQTFKDMLKFSGWMSLDPIAYSINGQGVNMLINSFFGTVVNTAFGIASQVGQAIDSLCMNLSTAFRPQMVQSYASGDKQRSLRLFISMSKISFSLFLLICLPIIFNLKYICDIWLGATYPPITLSITIIFIFVKMVGCLNHPITYLIMAKGSLKKYMIFTSAITSSIVVIAYILLKSGLPVQSVFISMLVIAILNQVVSVAVLAEEISDMTKLDYCKKIAFPCLSLLILVSLIIYLPHTLVANDLLRLAVDLLLSSISTAILAYLVFLNTSERNYIRSLIRGYISRKCH